GCARNHESETSCTAGGSFCLQMRGALLREVPLTMQIPVPKATGRRLDEPPPPQRPCRNDPAYFRFAIAVRSNDPRAMNAAPHQLEPIPPGLIAVTLPSCDAV